MPCESAAACPAADDDNVEALVHARSAKDTDAALH